MTITIPSHLTNAELIAAVDRCVRHERGATAQLVAHLAEFDLRGLHREAGYSSLFAYCRSVLGLAEHAAYNRIEAARAARRFPLILERLADGRINVTTVRVIAKHLTEETLEERLAAAAYRTKEELQELVARWEPRPDTPSSVRKVPDRRLASPSETSPVVEPAPVGTTPMEHPARLLTSLPGFEPPLSATPLHPPPAARVTPLAPERYEVRFTIGSDARAKLRAVQDLLRHTLPSGDVAQVFERALDALARQLARQKLAVVRRPRAKARTTAPGSRHIPSAVRRAVWSRDEGRCAFVSASGHRCRERGFLEYHHVTPFAVGGEATVANIQLRCRAHNAYESDAFRWRDGCDRISEPRPGYGLFLGFSTRSGTS